MMLVIARHRWMVVRLLNEVADGWMSRWWMLGQMVDGWREDPRTMGSRWLACFRHVGFGFRVVVGWGMEGWRNGRMERGWTDE